MTPFGTLADGRAVHRFALTDGGPLTASVLDWGSNLCDVRLDGVDHALTLGSPELAPYEGPLASAGGLIGPVVNRIGGARAELDGETYAFEAREGTDPPLTLHSGSAGTHRKLWQVASHAEDRLELVHEMPAGEGGFPGNRTVTALWEVRGAALTLEVRCTTDAPTWVNFANHSYWNLDGTETTEGHRLISNADTYLTAHEEGLVDGGRAEVAGTPLDFRSGRVLPGEGAPPLDHNLVLAEARRPLSHAATLVGAQGVRMTMETTEPGLQVYDGRKLSDVGAPDHQGRPVGPYRGLALEAQMWPDAPNRPDFPSVVLRPDETYSQVTRWSFAAP